MLLSHFRITGGGFGLICAIVCLLVVSLSGCTEATPTPEPVTIVFAHPEVDTEYYEPLAQEFNESHFHITVELQPSTGDALVDLSTGAKDVLAADAFSIRGLQEQGEILSLDPFIEQDGSFNRSDLYPGTMEILASEGETWAIPAGVDMYVMYYSQDLFDEHEVPYPQMGWSWDDFLNSTLAIRDADAGVFGYATTPGHFDAVMFIYQYGGRILDDVQRPTRTTFDDPLTVEALEWYAKLFHEYDVAPTAKQAREAFGGGRYAVYNGLRHGKVGMWMGMLSERGGLIWPVEWFVNWGVVPLPHAVRSVTYGLAEGYAVSSQTQNPDVCWQWICFLSRQMHYRLMPARQSLAESAAYEGLVGSQVAAVAGASMENAVLVSPWIGAEFEEAMNLFGEAIDQIVSGDATPQEAMNWAQQGAERISE
jgi:multiple sugar transport system substrate-binding protein